MYVLKQIPTDFKVTEMSERFQSAPGSSGNVGSCGPYLYFKLTKCEFNTVDAIRKVAFAVGLDPKDIGFAGTKDKNAVTSQYCSARGGRKERFLNLSIEGISVEVLGFGVEPISLGDLDGNRFEIVVRNLDSSDIISPITTFVNYFDEQRFSEHNAEIGKLILLGKLLEAAKLVDNVKVQDSLALHTTDGARALRLVPAKLLRMYVNAYQSLLWNRVVSRVLEQIGSEGRKILIGGENLFFPDNVGVCVAMLGFLDVPLIGFATSLVDLAEPVRVEIERVLTEEGISQKHFVIRAFPELSCEGNMRDICCGVSDLHVGEVALDPFFPGKHCVCVRFLLGKGSYATMAIRFMVHS